MNHFKMRHMWMSLAALAGTACLPLAAMAAAGNGNAPILGTLAATTGASIPAPDLATWIQKYSPGNNTQLVALTECFGGNALQAFPAGTFPNTTVISATSPGQAAIYGNFDTAAASALAPYTLPAPATTAQTVYQAGVANKNGAETPTTGGGLATTAFSLESTSTDDGAINSRNIVVYAGQPGVGHGNDGDAVQFDTIQTNFKDQINTTVTAVGDNPASPPTPTADQPWTIPGTAAGLQEAVQATGSPPNGSISQSIFFIADHGGLRNVAGGLNRSAGANASPTNFQPVPVAVGQPPANPAAPGLGEATPTSLTTGFQTFTDKNLPTSLVNPNAPMSSGGGGGGGSGDNTPCFSILVPLNNQNAMNQIVPDATNAANGLTVGSPVAAPTNLVNNALGGPGWILYLKNTNPKANPAIIELDSTYETIYDPIGGNLAGSDFNADAGIRVCFQIVNALGGLPQPNAPDGVFNNIFFNQTYDVSLLNYTGTAWDVAEFSQDNPAVANQLPEPSSLIVCGAAMTMLMSRRRSKNAA